MEALLVQVEHPEAYGTAEDIVRRLQKAGIVKVAMPISDYDSRAEILFDPIQTDALDRMVKEVRRFASERDLEVISGRGTKKTISLKGVTVKEVKLTTLLLRHRPRDSGVPASDDQLVESEIPAV